MQSFIAIHALGEKLRPNQAKLGTTCFMKMFGVAKNLLYEVPGGNLVDGLPPAASVE